MKEEEIGEWEDGLIYSLIHIMLSYVLPGIFISGQISCREPGEYTTSDVEGEQGHRRFKMCVKSQIFRITLPT